MSSDQQGVMPKLSILMFIQFFIWGTWYLSVSLYMYENGMGDVRYYAYTAGPLGAIIAPFFTGLIADRFFNTEKVLATLFLLAGAFMMLLPVVGGMEGEATATQGDLVTAMEISFLGATWVKGELFNYIILAHMLCYMPTLGLTASLAFHHMPKGSTQFPMVRLWGTIGWIVAGFTIAFALRETDAAGEVITKGELRPEQFQLGGIAAVLLGAFCFFLPKTPAPKKGQAVDWGTLFFVDAWKQLMRPSFAVFMIGSFLVCIPLAAYYASLQQQMEAMAFSNIAAWKNVGTFIEAGMMFLMPFFFRRLGVRWMIIAGIGAWALRYVLFSLGASPEGFWLVVGGIALHGFCYDFFFVTGQVYADQATGPDIRGQVQSMLIFFTQGLGLFFGALAANSLAAKTFGDVPSNTAAALELWPDFWWPLAGLAAVLMVLFIFFFRPDPAAETKA